MAAALPVLGFFIAQWCMVCLCLEERFTGTLRMCAFLAGMNGNPFGGDGVSAVGFYSTTGLFSGGDSLSDTRERSNRGADSFTNLPHDYTLHQKTCDSADQMRAPPGFLAGHREGLTAPHHRTENVYAGILSESGGGYLAFILLIQPPEDN